MKYLSMIFLLCCVSSRLSAADFKTADMELNRVYKEVLSVYKDDKDFIKNLRIAQQAWLKFRDAHLEALYPKADKQAAYGSVYPMCAGNVLAGLTEARTKQLRIWLEGIEEGEVC